MVVYHLSARKFEVIRVRLSRGLLKRVCMCSYDMIGHIYHHLVGHHGEPPRWLYTCMVERSDIVRWRKGIYVSYSDVEPYSYKKISVNENNVIVINSMEEVFLH